MTPENLRMLPAAALLAQVVWCAWSVEGPPTPAKPKPLPEFPAKLLASRAGPAPTGDPFGSREPEPRAAAPAAVAAKAPTAKEAAAPARRVDAANLKLSATAVGARPMAVINGRVYGVGERVRPAGKPSSEEQWVVVRISEAKALLRRGPEETELSFKRDGARPVVRRK